MAQVEVKMPKMGESITEGTVIVWLKQPGESIELDEPLLEIGTDKVDTEVPSPAAGVLKEIKVAEGDTVDVNTVIAVIETDVTAGGDGASPEPPKAEAPATPPTAAAAPAAAPIAAAAVAPTPASAPAAPVAAPASPAVAVAGGVRVEVGMPKMGESIMEGTVLTWHKKVGDAIDLDETLLEIATDKVDTEVPSPAKGIVAEILIPEGETVDVGTIIAVIASGEGAAVAAAPPATPSAPAAQPASAPAPQVAPVSMPTGDGAPVPRHDDDGRFYSPLVRSIAEAEGVSLGELKALNGSGREGRITKKDLLDYIGRRGTAPIAAPPPRPSVAPRPTVQVDASDPRVEIIEMDRMRQIIADHMVRSKSTSAHVTSFAEADVTGLVRLRESQKEAFLARENVKLTYTPFFVMAALEALKDHPLLNSSVEEKRVLVRKDFHIGIAVAIGKTGLVAPVIRFAGQKNLAGLAHAAADLAERARSKKLQPDELQGGTFTVTNIGSLGSLMGTPIINQPQVGILATGAIKKRPMVLEDPLHGDVIGIRHMMYVSLSYDHRIVDGAMASSFLHAYVGYLESLNPTVEI